MKLLPAPKKRIVDQMVLGILSDLPLFYQTCPVGPTLLERLEGGGLGLANSSFYPPPYGKGNFSHVISKTIGQIFLKF